MSRAACAQSPTVQAAERHFITYFHFIWKGRERREGEKWEAGRQQEGERALHGSLPRCLLHGAGPRTGPPGVQGPSCFGHGCCLLGSPGYLIHNTRRSPPGPCARVVQGPISSWLEGRQVSSCRRVRAARGWAVPSPYTPGLPSTLDPYGLSQGGQACALTTRR